MLHFCLFSFFPCLLASSSNQMSDNSLHTKKNNYLVYCFWCLGDEKKRKKNLKLFKNICVCACEIMSFFFSFFWFVSCRLLFWCSSLENEKMMKLLLFLLSVFLYTFVFDQFWWIKAKYVLIFNRFLKNSKSARRTEKKRQGRDDWAKVRFVWIIMHLLISVSEKRDVESNECADVSFFKAIERYDVVKKDASLPISFFVPIYYIRWENEKKKKTMLLIMWNTNRLTTLFIWIEKLPLFGRGLFLFIL